MKRCLDGNDFEEEGNEGEDEEEADDDSEAFEEQVYADGKIIILHGSYTSKVRYRYITTPYLK